MKASYCTGCRMSRMSRTHEFRRAAPVLACVDLDWTEHPTGRDGVHGQLVRSLRAGRRPRTYERISSHVPPRCVPMCTQPFLSSCSPPRHRHRVGSRPVHDSADGAAGLACRFFLSVLQRGVQYSTWTLRCAWRIGGALIIVKWPGTQRIAIASLKTRCGKEG